MKALLALLVVGSLVLARVSAEEIPAEVRAEIAKVCETVLCRTPVPIKLRLSDGKTFEMTLPIAAPIISGRLVTLFPNETIFVEAQVSGDELIDLTAVAENKNPEKTLTFEFAQVPDSENGTGMRLFITSPFKGVLKYRLGMMLPEGEEILATSSCPLRGEMHGSYEMWPHPIFQLVATDFRFVSPESAQANTCE